jgi:hypothetical protein
MDAAKDIHKEMLPIEATKTVPTSEWNRKIILSEEVRRRIGKG